MRVEELRLPKLLNHGHWDPETGCLIWDHGKVGRAMVSVDGQRRGVTRIVWEQNKGPIPKGVYVCHSCDNIRCVNPEHLWLGSPSENAIDMVNKGRNRPKKGQAAKGEANGNAKLTESQVREIRKRYAGGGVTYRVLAKEYGIAWFTAASIIKRRNWKHVRTRRPR